jgi:hypothetical protein
VGIKVATIAALVVVGACASSNMPTFRTDSAPGFSTAGWKTYSWAFTQAPPGMNAVMFQRIKDSLEQSLRARGFEPVVEGGDFIVGFTVGARDRVDVTNWGPVGPMYTGWGRPPGWGWSFNYNQVDVRTVTQGSLALDIFDGKTRQPVWHGFASRDLSRSGASPELISNAVNGLVDRFAGRPAG